MTTHTNDPHPTARFWISYVGRCFHTHPECPALADGQDKARSAGLRPWQVISTGPEGSRGRRPCRVCHATDPRDRWSEMDDRVLRIAHAKGRSPRVIAGMLDRTEAEVATRIAELGPERAA